MILAPDSGFSLRAASESRSSPHRSKVRTLGGLHYDGALTIETRPGVLVPIVAS